MSDGGENLVTIDCPACGKAISLPVGEGATAFACPLCGAEFELAGAGETAAAPGPAAPSIPPHQPTKRVSGGMIAVVTIFVAAGALALWAIFAFQTPAENDRDREREKDWPVATHSGHTIDGMTVRVQSVEVGPVRAKNVDGTAFVSDRDDYWTVKLRIRNGSEKPIEYRTWHAAEFPGSKPSAAVLKDESGKRFVMQQFEDIALLQGQTLKKSLVPRESTTDVIVFEAPEDFDRQQFKELRLELPGAACGVSESFRQVIPKTLVE